MSAMLVTEADPEFHRCISELKHSNAMLRRDLEWNIGPLEIVGQSPALARIREVIAKVAPTRSPVLLSGETGTGKELIARAIHALSGAAEEPFVLVDCTAIPEAQLELELFGSPNGSGSGGLIFAARKGTLFLDEIGALPQSVQARLLHALEAKALHPAGASKPVPFDARIVAATQRALRDEIGMGAFREDLYYRLSVMELHVPPLRERREDIPLLAAHLLRRFNRELGRRYSGIEEGALAALVQARWKGNIRELQNVLERAAILGSEPLLRESDFLSAPAPVATAFHTIKLKDAVRGFEQAHVQRILRQCDGDKRKAAKELGISLSSIYRYLGDTVNSGPESEPGQYGEAI